MIFRRLFFLILPGLVAVSAGFGQEVLTGLQINPAVRMKALETGALKSSSEGLDTIPMMLPFFDDFSANGVFPSAQRWIDRYAYENDDIPVYPVDLGAVTLDAINDSGTMYPDATPGPAGFIADHLTSRFIRLDSVFSPVPKALTPADSVYLSFYYQPQGRGKRPQPNDTLILEFLTIPAHDSIIGVDSVVTIPDCWQKIWYANGMSLDSFLIKYNTYFARVMIPVTDTVFFKKQFRFRFYNYASLASSTEPSWQANTDQWNLDNIYLNSGRNRYDTLMPEIRFIYRPPSMLKRYSAMPYPQYCNDPTNEARDTLDILITNRDAVSHMASYNYYVTEPGGTFSKSYNGGQYEIESYTQVPYVTYQRFAHPAVQFLMPISADDSASFLIRHVVREVTPGSVLGDTMEAYQRFYNYYAYDDGSAEVSYGLNYPGSKLAYRFKLNQSPDTLRAVDIYFNRTLGDISKQWFYLMVWGDNAGKPGDTLYSELVLPQYNTVLNKFWRYHLKRPLPITGTFYVGWKQTTSENLCFGWDTYNDSQMEIFYNTTGAWVNSAYTGSLMIRPVVGKPIPLGVGERTAGQVKLTVFPNPCRGERLHLTLSGGQDQGLNAFSGTITVFDLIGREVFQGPAGNGIDVTPLRNGIYFLEWRDKSGRAATTAKFILSR